MRRVLILATLLSLVLTSSVWAADISGTWTVTMTSPQGSDESFDVGIKAAGDNLAITTTNHPVLQTMEGTGTLKGDEIKMALAATGQTMAGVKINFTGKVTGNKMSGTREIDTSGMSSGSGGGQGGGAGGGAAGGGAPGGQGQAAGGQAGQGAQGGGSGGGQAPAGGGQAGGAAGGGQAAGGAQAEVSNAWTAVKK